MGVTTAAVAGTGHDTSVAGIIIGVGLGIDVLVGMLTATVILPKRNDGPGWLNDGDRRGGPRWLGDGLFPVFFESGWNIIEKDPRSMRWSHHGPWSTSGLDRCLDSSSLSRGPTLDPSGDWRPQQCSFCGKALKTPSQRWSRASRLGLSEP